MTNTCLAIPEKETLKSWMVMLTATSILGLIQTLLLARFIPFV